MKSESTRNLVDRKHLYYVILPITQHDCDHLARNYYWASDDLDRLLSGKQVWIKFELASLPGKGVEAILEGGLAAAINMSQDISIV